MESHGAPSRAKPFHGWKMVAALAVILFFTAGGGLYVFPVFIESYQREFGWSITQISGGAALFAIVMGFSNPFVGMLFARIGARKTMLVAAALTVVASLSYATLSSLWLLYLTMAVSGFAVSATTILPAQTLVTNWFIRARGRAMGLTMLGIGAGGFLLPPFNAFLIREIGWRNTWLFAAAVAAAVVMPLIAIFVRTKPTDLGQLPDGAAPRRGAASGAPAGAKLPGRGALDSEYPRTDDRRRDDASPAGAGVDEPRRRAASDWIESDDRPRGLGVRQALATVTFKVLVLVFLLQLIGVSIVNFHFVPFATQEAGFAAQPAAFFYGLAVGCSIGGRLLFGWLGDRWTPAHLMALTLLLLACGPALLELLIVRMGLRDANLLWLFAVPYGAGLGGHAVLLPMVVGRCFGELHFGRIMGLLMSGFAVGVLVGLPLAGWIFDTTGSYEPALLLAVAALLTASLLTMTVRAERHRVDFVTE